MLPYTNHIHHIGKKNSKEDPFEGDPFLSLFPFFFSSSFRDTKSRYSLICLDKKIFSFLLLMHYVIRISTSNHAAHREIHTRATPNSGAHAYEFDFCKRVRIRVEAARIEIAVTRVPADWDSISIGFST